MNGDVVIYGWLREYTEYRYVATYVLGSHNQIKKLRTTHHPKN